VNGAITTVGIDSDLIGSEILGASSTDFDIVEISSVRSAP
jgi:hypothetical protein